MALPTIVIIVLATIAILIVARAWRRSRDQAVRRANWPAMDFSNVGSHSPSPSTPPDGLRSFSTNFDLHAIRPFLERLRPLIASGFGPDQIDRVTQAAAALAHDQEQTLAFPIRHAGKDANLQIQIVMDDIDAPDLYFFSPPDLTREIESQFMQFAKGRAI